MRSARIGFQLPYGVKSNLSIPPSFRRQICDLYSLSVPRPKKPRLCAVTCFSLPTMPVLAPSSVPNLNTSLDLFPSVINSTDILHSPFFTNDLPVAFFVAGLATLWLSVIRILAKFTNLSPAASRKLVHLSCGPFFTLTWTLFSTQPTARYAAAIVPILFIVRILYAGSDRSNDSLSKVSLLSPIFDRRPFPPLFLTTPKTNKQPDRLYPEAELRVKCWVVLFTTLSLSLYRRYSCGDHLPGYWLCFR